MCGIVAVLRPPLAEDAEEPSGAQATAELLKTAAEAMARLGTLELESSEWVSEAEDIAGLLDSIDRRLKKPRELRRLVNDASRGAELGSLLACLSAGLSQLENGMETRSADLGGDELERVNAALIRLKDSVWSLERDRLGAANEIRELAGTPVGRSAMRAWMSIQTALSALDRLEVRGRDSAGLHLWIKGHGLDLGSSEVRSLIAERDEDPRFSDQAVHRAGAHLGIVYKTAAEIGELGNNRAALRSSLRQDGLLRRALASDSVEVAVLAHTRWASVGLVNEPNAHPVNGQESPPEAGGAPVVAVLNGDVDNYLELMAQENLRISTEITTDAKVIPVLISRRLAAGRSAERAFLETVSSFVGSVAVAAAMGDDPDRLFLALRGSGQALYVGVAEDLFIIASEPYGVVAETKRYLRLDGETPGNPQNPSASRGQVVVLDARRAGKLAGIERWAYDGTRMPVAAEELKQVDITTRDVDLGEHPHYLLKEITEAPGSFRKTLRGRLRSTGRVELGSSTFPEDLKRRWRSGEIERILVIGQGTAAVAGQGIARALKTVLSSASGPSPSAARDIRALPATELSGFELRESMADTLIVAVSQSGTTTDTNRTVDLVRARGAVVVSIVNRRHSDLTDKSDGVLYTSDGRDVEMSVASTKAFYSQIAAGFLLAFALFDLDRPRDEPLAPDQRTLRQALPEMPAAMNQVLGRSDRIAEVARRHAPSHRYWAVVGSGANRTAAEEVRIKLSELCYKSVACDATEDKKHIDLSSEPMILVCATGVSGSTADDMAKEVAIFKAHKAVPIVIADDGEERFGSAAEVIGVPPVEPALSFVLSAMAGHLFGYHAALAIDRQARPLREIRVQIEKRAAEIWDSQESLVLDPLQGMPESIAESSSEFLEGLEQGSYDGHLSASTASEIASLLRVVEDSSPPQYYRRRLDRVASPAVALENLGAALTRGIDELTRPVDAIKHQAKTVTVGISRSDEALLLVPLVKACLGTGADRAGLSYSDLKMLAILDPAVERTLGFTRYRLDGDPADDQCEIRVVDRGGISRDLRSRTESSPRLKGTKRSVAEQRRLLVARGLSDGRTFLLVPEIAAGRTTGLTLLHTRFHDRASAAVMRTVLEQYRGRYSALRDAVMETEHAFDEALLATLRVEDLLIEPIPVLAGRWRSSRPEVTTRGR